MEEDVFELAREFNYIARIARTNYFKWSYNYDFTFLDLVILINIRDYGFLDKRVILENYFMQTQTVNNVINRYLKLNLLEVDYNISTGNEKLYRLTSKGQEFAKEVYDTISFVEAETVKKFGPERFRRLIDEYSDLNDVLVDTVANVMSKSAS